MIRDHTRGEKLLDKEKEELEREKTLAHENGKEPFDFLKFISIYVHDTGTFERLKPDEPESVREQYEWFYYHFYPQFMTIEEFAEFLNRVDESY